ncbi:MAG TPA: hypothetical protein VHV28_02690 [Solirubrobacteraceae bacterium]|jgi:hypothetical protein|nr:hypothetical protein [Solirubrobacteraceae bacterium]
MWLSERVDGLRDAFFGALDAGDEDDARGRVAAFKDDLNALLDQFRRDALDHATRALDRERADLFGHQPLPLDEWVRLRTRLLVSDVLVARRAGDEEKAQREMEHFEARLIRQFAAIGDEVMAETTDALDDEAKARREAD